ncbi:hypothetical protein HOE31_00895, partial [bacterium]|nr:hypothetical protein [bacterium]
MIEDKKLENILLKNDLIEKEALEKAKNEAKKEKEKLFDYIIEKDLVNIDSLYSQLAAFYKLPLIKLKNETIRKDVLFLIPEPIAQTHEILAFNKDAMGISIATTDPTDLQTIEFLKKKLETNLKLHLTTPKSFKEGIKQYHQSIEAEFKN